MIFRFQAEGKRPGTLQLRFIAGSKMSHNGDSWKLSEKESLLKPSPDFTGHRQKKKNKTKGKKTTRVCTCMRV